VTYSFVALLCISSVCLIVGVWPKVASLVLGVSWISVHSIAFSTGKIDHGILLQVAPLVLAFSCWGDTFRLRESRHVNRNADGFPIAIFAFLTAYWMATAGWQKMMHNWLDPSFSAVYAIVYTNSIVTDRPTLVGQLALQYFPTWAWELNDWVTVVFELSGIFFVWKRKLFRCWIAAACFFHLGIDLFMSIPYAAAPLAYAAFAPWSRLGLVRWLHSGQSRRRVLLVAILLLALLANAVQLIYSFSLARSIVWAAPVLGMIFLLSKQPQSASEHDLERGSAT